MKFKRLKEIVREAFKTTEQTDEYEKALYQLLAMIEETEEYRRKVRNINGEVRR